MISEADFYCSGSDQVWNNYYTKKFDPSYFLAFAPSGSTCISIASSFGKSSFNEEDSAFINNQLSKYTYLSVRETSGIKLLREMGYSDVDLMLDPTLLVSRIRGAALPRILTKRAMFFCISSMEIATRRIVLVYMQSNTA